MLPFGGPPFQKMIFLWGIRFASLCIKINLQLSRVNGKTVQREKKTSGDAKSEIEKKKILTKAKKRRIISPAVCASGSLSQRVSSDRPDHRGSTGSPTKRKGSEHQLQEVSFCSFGSTKSGP